MGVAQSVQPSGCVWHCCTFEPLHCVALWVQLSVQVGHAPALQALLLAQSCGVFQSVQPLACRPQV